MGLNPLVLEQLHINQALWLMCDKDKLAGRRKVVSGTPRELKEKGLIDELPEMSYVQAVQRGVKRKAARG